MSRAAVASGLRAGSMVTGPASDETLAERAAGGDGQAFGAIFDRHHQGLYRYCLALVGNSHDAQDALQNTMIKVLRALPGEQRRIALKPWLYRIAHNESIELVRRRRETRPLDPDLAAAGAGMAEAAAARERLRVLIADLAKLPERQRGALIMRELAGLDFAEIATALGTSPAVVRQTLYEARLSLRQMDEGREMSCERVTRALSDGDGRVARRRDLRSHLRTCPSCRDFTEAIESREREFAALASLPAAAAAGLLQGVLGGNGAVAGGFATALGGETAKTLGVSAALKGAATVAVVAAIGAAVADQGGLVDLGSPTGGDSQMPRAGRPAAHGLPGTRSAPSSSVAAHATTRSGAGLRSAHDASPSQAAKPLDAPSSAAAATPGEEATLAQPGDTGAGENTAAAGAGSDAQSAPASAPAAQGSEKQLPSASEHGQETAASHKAENHGQETAASHKAEDHGAGAEGHPAHPAHPTHPSTPGAEEEPQPAPASPESNGNGKGNSPPAGAEEATPEHGNGKGR